MQSLTILTIVYTSLSISCNVLGFGQQNNYGQNSIESTNQRVKQIETQVGSNSTESVAWRRNVFRQLEVAITSATQSIEKFIQSVKNAEEQLDPNNLVHQMYALTLNNTEDIYNCVVVAMVKFNEKKIDSKRGSWRVRRAVYSLLQQIKRVPGAMVQMASSITEATANAQKLDGTQRNTYYVQLSKLVNIFSTDTDTLLATFLNGGGVIELGLHNRVITPRDARLINSGFKLLTIDYAAVVADCANGLKKFVHSNNHK